MQRASGEKPEGLHPIFEAAHEETAPIFGVQRALQDSGSDCFILAVDYPLVTSEVLRYIQR